VNTIYLSYTELQSASRFRDIYEKLQGEELTQEEEQVLKQQGDAALAEFSCVTRETFLELLEDFELKGTEFQIKIAPDDARLVTHQKGGD